MRAKIPAMIDASIEAALFTTYAEMTNRIWNKNQTITGASFGGYESEEYKKLRASLGNEIGVKDLFVYGNLKKSMRPNYTKRAITVDTSVKVKSIPYTKKDGKRGKQYTADPNLVMRGQEQQIVGTPGKGIFEASQEEVNISIAKAGELFAELMTKELTTG